MNNNSAHEFFYDDSFNDYEYPRNGRIYSKDALLRAQQEFARLHDERVRQRELLNETFNRNLTNYRAKLDNFKANILQLNETIAKALDQK